MTSRGWSSTKSAPSSARPSIGNGLPPVALNLSAVDIVRHDLLEHVDNHIAASRSGAPAGFEITETGLIGNETLAIHHLQELEKRGNSISIDDFGTGYSSLSKLSSFRFWHQDRPVIRRQDRLEPETGIIKAIVSLADAMSCITSPKAWKTKARRHSSNRWGARSSRVITTTVRSKRSNSTNCSPPLAEQPTGQDIDAV
jgi:predicted signal transduction protein with EAL and GGDEF domain